MTDHYQCPRFKSHSTRDRRFQWERMSNGDVRAAVYCNKCEPVEFIDVIEHPEQFLDLLGVNPFPPMKPML